jgi:hypothetical protein
LLMCSYPPTTLSMWLARADQIIRSDDKSVGSAELGLADAHAVKAQKQTTEMRQGRFPVFS